MAKKKIKLDRGTIYQKEEKGTYYFRYQVDGRRKAVSLKTKNLEEAKKKAADHLKLLKAESLDKVADHVREVRFGVKHGTLRLKDAWKAYDHHPDKATPSTVSEQQAYKLTWREFLDFVDDGSMLFDAVESELAVRYANHMRAQEIAVDTHNRKIRRLRKVFETLSQYRTDGNPFSGKALMRKDREEQNAARRLSFTREQEQKLLEVLQDRKHKVKNKPEIRVLFHLGIFTGQGMKDCALLQWHQVSFDRKRIWVKQFKTGAEVSIPIADQLMTVLEEAKQWQRDDYVLPSVAERYLIKDKNGKNIGANLLNIDVMRVIKWTGIEPSVKVPGRKKKVTVYGFHSLRHSFASRGAELGVPKAAVQSILGAANDIIDKYYVHIGDEAQEKAIQMISGNGNTLAQRYEKALEYLAAVKTKKNITELDEVERILRG